MKMKIQRTLFIIVAFGFLAIIASADGNISRPTRYLTFVHDGMGFYKVRNLDMPPRVFNYENRVLYINQGDSMIWENDADKQTLTILSDQNLWTSQVGQIAVGHRIDYTFDNPGTYGIYIKEASSKRQTIVVNTTGNSIVTPVGTKQKIVPITTPRVTNTPISTENHNIAPIATPRVTNTPKNIVTDPITIAIPANAANIGINMSWQTIAGIAVVIFSLFIFYKTGKDKN